jgi:hypothetical protein
MSRDMPNMSKVLVKRMFSDPKVRIADHWKVRARFEGTRNLGFDILSFFLADNIPYRAQRFLHRHLLPKKS